MWREKTMDDKLMYTTYPMRKSIIILSVDNIKWLTNHDFIRAPESLWGKVYVYKTLGTKQYDLQYNVSSLPDPEILYTHHNYQTLWENFS